MRRVILSLLCVVLLSSSVVTTTDACAYPENNDSSLRKRQTQQQQKRQLQWGSPYPDFTSLVSAPDFITSSLNTDNTTTTASIQVSSEGTRSIMNLQNGDWMRYSLGIPVAGLYHLALRISAPSQGGSVRIVSVDTRAVMASLTDLPGTGDNAWATVSTNLTLPEGLHMIEVYVDQGGWSLQWLNIYPVDGVVVPVASPVAMPVSAAPIAATPVTVAPVVMPITTPVAMPMAPPVSAAPVTTPTSVVPTIPSVVIPMAPEAMPPLFSPVAVPEIAPVTTPIVAPAVTPVMAPFAVPSAPTPISTPVATPPILIPVAIPILPPITTPTECNLQINASSYTTMSGVNYEAGTNYLGWLDPGDWIVYNVSSLPAGNYQLDTAIASPEGGGSFLLVDATTQTSLMMQTKLPMTGSWTNWQVASTVFALPATASLELRVYSDGWNLQSLCFRSTTAAVPPFQVPGPPTMEPTTAATNFTRTSSEAPVRPPHDCSSPF